MSVKPALVIATLFLGACAASVKPIVTPTPVATTRRGGDGRSNLPPLRLPPDSATASAIDSATRAGVADLPVTVLPTIVGHRATAGKKATVVADGVTRNNNDQTVRIALAVSRQSVRIDATGDVELFDPSSNTVLARLRAGDSFTAESRNGTIGTSLRSVQSSRGTLIVRPAEPGALVGFDSHRYRGEIGLAISSGGLTVINRVNVEDYLRGVVPLEIGTDRTMTESAAVEAQAIAARSYAYTRMDDARPYDMVATVSDQVYGGVDAERPLSDAAINATDNMVMMYGGKVINAPYHSNSGGVTAAASEVWRGSDEPYLVSVSDRIPGTDHYYGEDSPRFRWTRTLSGESLSSMIEKYLPQYSTAQRGNVGTLRGLSETGRTQSGRIAGLVFQTDRGSFTVKGDAIRFVLRSESGEILPSTLFTFDANTDRKGHVTQIVIKGSGNGHGVGMDQWGAIARARAGQDVSTILHAYYPGTTIGRVI
jgi:stage II sporulation protein D